MTFTEAAIEVLRREGKPLHFKKIAEIAVRESLLDHIGKIPEEVMGGQLANHCRLPRPDRRLTVVQSGTFALAEWALDEDPTGLDGIIEPPPEDEIPYRGRERHPVPSRDVARSTGRGESRGRRREEGEERRARRFPPPAEVAFEILAGADRSLTLSEIAAQGAERLLMPDAFVRDAGALRAALTEDNRRREGAGRKPLFALDGDAVSLVAQPEPGERAAAASAVTAAARAAAPGDIRRAGLAALRHRLRDCDAPTVERIAVLLLEKLGYREIKVAKRGREHVVYTARRKMGLADLRHCVRVMRTGGEVARREVSELRRDIGNYGAQIGIVLSPGEAGREARADATSAGQLPVILLCGDALAETMAEAVLGCRVIAVPEVDETFFRQAAETAAQEETARRARREERERREQEPQRERRGRGEERERDRDRDRVRQPESARNEPQVAEPGEAAVAPTPEAVAESAAAAPPQARPRREEVAAAPAVADAAGDEDEGDEGEEGDELEAGEGAAPAEGAEAAPSGEGEPKRRRRRRRRRGGRGRGERREAAAGGAPAPAAGEPGAAAPAEGGAPPAEREAPQPPRAPEQQLLLPPPLPDRSPEPPETKREDGEEPR